MISIDRTRASPPAGLLAGGPSDLKRIARLRRSGQLKSEDFKGSIYSSNGVRTSLWKMQHRKCCFCEHKYERKYSTVEHFRPKTKARRRTGRKVWGYWWLAYEFNNLYFCCSNCNTPKSDWFPLAGNSPGLRPRQFPWASVPPEKNLILDPGVDEPVKHITFVRDTFSRLRITHLDERGKWTIEAAKLDRDDLDELRDDHYDSMISGVIQHYQDGQLAAAAAKELARFLSRDKAQFALLARVAFGAAGLLP